MAKKKPKGSPDAKEVFVRANDFRLTGHLLSREISKYFSEKNKTGQLPGSIKDKGGGIIYYQFAVPGKIEVPYFVPYITVAAFSCELYFKCLHCLESGQTPFGHPLDELFSSLPIALKRQIEKIWDQVDAINPHTAVERSRQPTSRKIEELLKKGASAFETWRYFWEGNSSDFSIAHLADVLHNIVVAKQSTWGTPNIFNAAGIILGS